MVAAGQGSVPAYESRHTCSSLWSWSFHGTFTLPKHQHLSSTKMKVWCRDAAHRNEGYFQIEQQSVHIYFSAFPEPGAVLGLWRYQWAQQAKIPAPGALDSSVCVCIYILDINISKGKNKQIIMPLLYLVLLPGQPSLRRPSDRLQMET